MNEKKLAACATRLIGPIKPPDLRLVLVAVLFYDFALQLLLVYDARRTTYHKDCERLVEGQG